jgi:GLEYA domain
MAANGISSLSTKQAKQTAKLELAKAKRKGYILNADGTIASGPNASANFYRSRNEYDITKLPTQYSGNSIVDNTNLGGLILGRPWVEISYLSGVYRSTYSTYYNGTKTYFNTASVTGTAVVTDFQVSTATTNFSYQYLGYILADYTGTWTFTFTTDDYCHIFIGPNAVPPPQLAGAENAASPIGSGSFTVSMIAGTYYPIKVMYGNSGGPGVFTLTWARNGSSTSTNWTGKLFYNAATNGF